MIKYNNWNLLHKLPQYANECNQMFITHYHNSGMSLLSQSTE